MMEAYRSGDPYLAFAKQAGAATAEATKATHNAVREQFNACVLAVQYGMGAEALAQRSGQTPIRARELLRLHRETYRVFWRWSDAAVDYAMLNGHLHTVFGWRVQVPASANDRSLRNFPMQANGAEMLRLACCLGTEQGIEVCAPVHDAVLICAPLDELDADLGRMQDVMRETSKIVLKDFVNNSGGRGRFGLLVGDHGRRHRRSGLPQHPTVSGELGQSNRRSLMHRKKPPSVMAGARLRTHGGMRRGAESADLNNVGSRPWFRSRHRYQRGRHSPPPGRRRRCPQSTTAGASRTPPRSCGSIRSTPTFAISLGLAIAGACIHKWPRPKAGLFHSANRLPTPRR
jgi:hypothetical protein